MSSMFGLTTEETVILRPEGVVNWGYSEKADRVYQVYVSLPTKNHNGSFGFWVHDDSLKVAYRKAFYKAVSHMKWSYKVRLEKWLK